MSNAKQKPTHRLRFAPIIGTDETGKDQLGRSIEVGAVWPRRDGKGAIQKFDIVPQDFSKGVLFLDPVTTEDRGFA